MDLSRKTRNIWQNKEILKGIELLLMACWFEGAIKDSSVTTSIYLIILVCASREFLQNNNYELSLTKAERYLWIIFSIFWLFGGNSG